LRRLGPPLADPDTVESALTPEALTAVAFDPEGRLVVRFDPGLFGVPGAGQAVVVVDRERTDDLLSDAGRAAQDSAVTPRVRPAPAAAPAPSASATARGTATPSATRPAAVNCRVQSCIALTFDDGPSATTPTLLDRLAAAGAPATFFVLGPNADARPDLLRRMVAEGHELGNHTWTHRVLTALTPDDVRDDVVRTNLEITGAGGTPALLRPPFGVTDARVNEVADGFGMQVALWNVDPQDWKTTDPAVITQHVLGAARRGAIVLLHDTSPATVDAVPGIVAGLRAKGFVPVTLSKMYAESIGGRGGAAR
jgi:peptidoglycan/xylan/chitin deacetylase (PgdA/CDA1 family)